MKKEKLTIVRNTLTLRCFYCGNETVHTLINQNISNIKYEMIERENKFEEYKANFHYYNFKCSTCTGLNIIGGFEHEIDLKRNRFQRLFPKDQSLRIPGYQLPGKKQPVPKKILNTYEEIWFLKHQVPNGFANQIRRCLEMICKDKHAEGRTLYDKLNDLTTKGFLPDNIKELGNLVRKIGNIGSHDSERNLDMWDVELLDDFFKTIVDYVYVVPAKIKRMNKRIKLRKK